MHEVVTLCTVLLAAYHFQCRSRRWGSEDFANGLVHLHRRWEWRQLSEKCQSGEFPREKKPSHLGSSGVGLQCVELELV